MATATQLMPSPTAGLKSSFSPYTDSPSSPAPFSQVFSNSNRNSNTSDHLAPPPSPYPSTVDPSPVDSNGTNGTEIEDDAQEIDHASEGELSDIRSLETEEITSPESQDSMAKPYKLDTMLPIRARADSDDAPQSVIHAPMNFKQFNRVSTSAASSRETSSDQTAVVSPQTPEAHMGLDEKGSYTHPIDTTVPSSGTIDRSTPRAQTRLDHDDERRRSRASVSLADIAEAEDVIHSDATSLSNGQDGSSMPTPSLQGDEFALAQTMGEALHGINETEREVASLKTALDECWTLCNTLAKLSQNHRQRMFHYSGTKADEQEHAWRTCWRLCQKLYESRDEHHATQIKPTLELCRDFCQALFDVRHRGDDASDSVLRVSFELNNHLYNAHDRTLPEAFRERTLDFYLTLCHRLMKQRTSLPEDTDALLHACWSLAEMLFSIRQNSRDGRPADEELLGSAIQACWELCDLFREGWTQVRPERGTPRPAQFSFNAGPASVSHSQVSHSERSGRTSTMSGSYHSVISNGLRRQEIMPLHPETPTTIFDDREEFSPADPEPQVPNILILGPEAGQTRTHDRWSSAASSLSTYSDASVHTSSTATAGREDATIIRLKGLLVKAAINTGFNRSTPLPDFVSALPSNSFGDAAWQTQLFDNYRKLVLSDPTLRPLHNQPLRRLTSGEIGRAVQQLSRSDQFSWMRDLYRFVFGCYPDDPGQRNLIINVPA
ncbi:hypothetical protein BU24DRAFT_152348 [Aaosphaeria arxii CBS 175.79]|uniref:DUF7624 domain-containing protein n=1 Tax=Aaosphaeria arxii CBS 175.79 TaxID=1450172 RepID=A0A6A5XW53_9PLEO|nr:uncharacterized protein BU24DRAFT_152348 [Aaosphaeria arxii CBS 175.79]KAF2017548.1 hypothetical protein BU24DRAFT_152348 [Aaosphaeria arxii CBS 175.79]